MNMRQLKLESVERIVATEWRLTPLPHKNIVLPDLHTKQRMRVTMIVIQQPSNNVKTVVSFWGFPVDGKTKEARFFQPHIQSAASLVPEIEELLKAEIKGRGK